MSADRKQPPPFNPAMVDQLACPACHSAIRPTDSALICVACGRAYPVVDGIPVLIADRAASRGPSR